MDEVNRTADRLAIVSGGSRGLGAALCESWIERGWQVLELSRSAPHAYSRPLDLGDPAAAARTLAEVLQPLAARRWDEIAIVNNAALLTPIGPVADQPRDQVIGNLTVNVTGGVLLMAEVVAQFQASTARKTLVNISSGAALRGMAGWSLYCASKAALEHFVRSLAAEQALRAQPLVAINFDPGVMDTGMQAAIRASNAEAFPDHARFVERHRAGELRPPAVVAEALLRLVASDAFEGGGRYSVADWLA